MGLTASQELERKNDEHGLNVYFDGDFSGHKPLWTDQFPENMESGNCRGVVAFIDDAYENNEVNIHADQEVELFNELFDKAVEAKILDKTIKPYKKSQKNNNGLSKELCATMCREVLGYVNANDNVYGV